MKTPCANGIHRTHDDDPYCRNGPSCPSSNSFQFPSNIHPSSSLVAIGHRSLRHAESSVVWFSSRLKILDIARKDGINIRVVYFMDCSIDYENYVTPEMKIFSSASFLYHPSSSLPQSSPPSSLPQSSPLSSPQSSPPLSSPQSSPPSPQSSSLPPELPLLFLG